MQQYTHKHFPSLSLSISFPLFLLNGEERKIAVGDKTQNCVMQSGVVVLLI